jgi:hypothetical protein
MHVSLMIYFIHQLKQQIMSMRIIVVFTLWFVFMAGSMRAGVQETAGDSSWTRGGSIGLDMSQLALVNPRVGAGENKLAFGGLTTLFAKYQEGKIAWENDASIQLAVQRLGGADRSFTKNLDLLRVNSKLGYVFNPKLNGALQMTFESLLLPTYSDLSLSSGPDNVLQAQFLSPASVLFAPGLDYVHNEHLSVFLAPVAYKSVIVLNDDLAALGVHGNPWTSATDFENVKHEMGANFRAKYSRVYHEKLSVGSELNLFYDYLAEEHGAEFLDVIWINELGYELIKGFSLNLLLDLRWDRDIASVLPEGEVDDGLARFRKWMITEAFVIKYNYLL